jgi:phosphoribosyl 1,2-cyclic phosphodiesterase
MFQTAVLASGSKGNSILIRTDKTKILLDAGLSGKRIVESLEKIGLSGEKLAAVIVSHEHSDHIKGAGIICRKYKIPLYISKLTYEVSKVRLGKIEQFNLFESGDSLEIGDIIIKTIPGSHDSVDHSNFTFMQKLNPDQKLAVVTDNGFSPKNLLLDVENCTTIILESNYDTEMLMTGPYTWELKQRIKSRKGHFSNEQSVCFLNKILHSQLKNVILAHLSEENNKPEIAFENMNSFLKKNNHRIFLIVASQTEPIGVIDI